MVLVGIFPIDLQFDSMNNCFRRMNLTSWRRLQRNNFSSSKTSWRRLQRCLQNVLQKCLQDVFARRVQDVFKTSCNYVLKKSWKHLEDVLEYKKMLHQRRQDVFKTSSLRLHQDEWLLGRLFLAIELYNCFFNSQCNCSHAVPNGFTLYERWKS